MSDSNSKSDARLPDVDVLLHDGPCIVVNKPGGVLTQGPPGVDSLELRVRQYIKLKEEKTGKIYLGVPHRLDRPVSGVIVFARHIRAAQRISAQFEQRQVTKKYWTVVSGTVEPESGNWTDWLRKVPDRAMSEIVEPDSVGAQQAILDYQVLQRLENKTCIEIELQTGRTHQIRLQAASRGFPILGDELYGSHVEFGPQSIDLRSRWIALLARRLIFQHPTENKRVDVIAPIPQPWRQIDGLALTD